MMYKVRDNSKTIKTIKRERKKIIVQYIDDRLLEDTISKYSYYQKILEKQFEKYIDQGQGIKETYKIVRREYENQCYKLFFMFGFGSGSSIMLLMLPHLELGMNNFSTKFVSLAMMVTGIGAALTYKNLNSYCEETEKELDSLKEELLYYKKCKLFWESKERLEKLGVTVENIDDYSYRKIKELKKLDKKI